MKHLSVILLLIALAPIVQATPDLSGGRRGSTPYDPYMAPVHTVLNQLNGSAPDFKRVAELVRIGYGFEYSFETPYLAAMPRVTAAHHSGDCKAKSLWLANEMNDPSVRFVIGKARRTSEISHAWLMWKNKGRWWILDPTNASHPIAANRVSRDEYLVSYAYDRTGSYSFVAPSRFERMVAGHN